MVKYFRYNYYYYLLLLFFFPTFILQHIFLLFFFLILFLFFSHPPIFTYDSLSLQSSHTNTAHITLSLHDTKCTIFFFSFFCFPPTTYLFNLHTQNCTHRHSLHYKCIFYYLFIYFSIV